MIFRIIGDTIELDGLPVATIHQSVWPTMRYYLKEALEEYNQNSSSDLAEALYTIDNLKQELADLREEVENLHEENSELEDELTNLEACK